MGNICCGVTEESDRGGPCRQDADHDEEENGDTNYDAKALLQEQQVLLHGRKRNLARKTISSTPIDIAADYVSPVYPKPPEIVAFLEEALLENFVFDQIEDVLKAQLIDAMQPAQYEEGDYIIKQGGIGDFFFVVEEGSVSFVVSGATVGGQGKGCSFGELALLYSTPRAASVMAARDCKVWKVDQTTFRSVLASKDLQDGAQIQCTLEKVNFLKDLKDSMKTKLADALTPVVFKEGERIMNKGDEGKLFYIIKSGEVRLHDIGHGQSAFEDQILGSGDYFGERALLTGDSRAAHATATTNCTTLAISRETFEEIIGPLDQAMERCNCLQLLKSIPAMAGLEESELDGVVARREEETFEAGEKFVPCGKMYIIMKGCALFQQDGALVKLQNGDYFGDMSDVCKIGESITVDTDLTCFTFSKAAIHAVTGDMSRLKPNMRYSVKAKTAQLKLKDLKKHRILGMGAFGKVWLVSPKKEKGTTYALKMVSKRQLLASRQDKGITREKNVMESVNHPLLMKMISAFQDPDYLYFVLNLVQGGELFDIVHTDTYDGLPVESARFYSACVMEAFAYLHTRHIVYRDLKPENILIDNEGYCVVVDFGFAKLVKDKTYTLCGTPEYIAPEVILSKGHNHMADIWSFGCLCFELISGETPFFDVDVDQMALMKIICKGKFKFPTEGKILPDNCKDLVSRLLVTKPAERIGNLANGVQDILDHPWFDGIDFADVREKKLKAPFIPNISDPFDSSNFTNDFSREERQVETFHKRLSTNDQEAFKNF